MSSTRPTSSVRLAALAAAALLAAVPAAASETIAYSYDALGRLVKVARSGTVNNGITACYSYDSADNRSNVTVATSDCSSAAAPSFSVNDVSATEGSSLVFTITKSGSTTSSFSVSYATANGSAVAGTDYTAVSGTLTFAASETSKTVSVSTIQDSDPEANETFYLNLSSPSGGATITDSQGIGTIGNDDIVSDPCQLC